MSRLFTRQEVEAHNTKQDALIIIDNVVYDVTPLLEDHPGGAEVLLDNAGRDASQSFHDVGHTDEAYDWRKRFEVGEVPEVERWPVRGFEPGAEPLSLQGLAAVVAPPLVLAAAAYLLFTYLF